MKNCLEEYNYRFGDLLLHVMDAPQAEAGAGGSPRDGSGTSCGDGKRQKTSHCGGVLGPAKNAAEISDSSFRGDGSSPPETPDANIVSCVAQVRDNWHNERDARLQHTFKKRIAELKEITARPEFKDRRRPRNLPRHRSPCTTVMILMTRNGTGRRWGTIWMFARC